MRLLACSLFLASFLPGQTVTFSPQAVAGKAAQLTLWDVDISAPGKASIPAAQIYALAASHLVGHIDATLANTILTTRAGRSPLAVVVEAMGLGSAATAIAAVVKNGGVVTTGTGAKIQNGAVVAAGVAAIALPYIKLQLPVTPNPAITAALLGEELKLGSDGSGSALFYSLPSAVGAFTEALK